MTTPKKSNTLAAYEELKALAKTLNQQLVSLNRSVAVVRHMLYEEAERIRTAAKDQEKPVSRAPIAPVTVFHGKGGPISVPGHECTEPPTMPARA
jgi:hypothetical protein